MKTLVIQKGLVFRGGKLLALRRNLTDARRPNEWDLPGGWLEEGESFIEGLHREIREEANIEAKNPRLVFAKSEIRVNQEGENKGQKCNCVFLFYNVVAETGEPVVSPEHSEAAWMTLEEARSAFEYDLHKEVFSHLLDNHLISERHTS